MLFCQSTQYGAIGSIIAAAPSGKFQQCTAHGFERCRLTTKVFGMGQSNSLHFTARTPAVVPQAEESGDLLKREPKIAGVGDEP